MLWNATGIDFNAAGGGNQGGNAAALDVLKNQFGDNGKNVRYYAAGDKPEAHECRCRPHITFHQRRHVERHHGKQHGAIRRPICAEPPDQREVRGEADHRPRYRR